MLWKLRASFSMCRKTVNCIHSKRARPKKLRSGALRHFHSYMLLSIYPRLRPWLMIWLWWLREFSSSKTWVPNQSAAYRQVNWLSHKLPLFRLRDVISHKEVFHRINHYVVSYHFNQQKCKINKESKTYNH